MKTLEFLLAKRRPRGTEEATAKSVLPKDAEFFYDTKGSFMFAMVDVVVDKNHPSRTIFSSHLDSVEYDVAGYNVLNVSKDGIMTVQGGGILGADDGAGVWLMIKMMDKNVAGRYMFFAGEESGGIGSKFAVANYPELFSDIDRAIAFDRRGNKDVIVSQYVGTCASPQFGIALADALSCDEYPFDVADGVYTDTAEMIGIVPECVNVSCGYLNEHSQKESLDLVFLFSLLDKLIKLDWGSLPTKRVPMAPKSRTKSVNKFADFDWDFDFDLPNKKSDAAYDVDLEEFIDGMYMAGITVSDLVAYIKKTGDTDLL